MHRVIAVVLTIPSLASAQPSETPPLPVAPAVAGPPAPLVMPELAPRTRYEVSTLLSSGILIREAQLGVGGSYADARLPGVELFGDVKVRLAALDGFEEMSGENGSGFALGNLRAGARYHVALGSLRIAPAVWAWIPTSTASNANHDDWEAISAVADNRAFGDGLGAAGVALDVGYYGASRFVQVEAGSAIVLDGGPQVDDLFFALGYGSQVTASTSFLAEMRVEVFPDGTKLYGPALGFGRHDRDAMAWRVRFCPWALGIAIGVDVTRRFP